MDAIPTINYVVLAILINAALASLLYGLFKVWKRIQAGKPFVGTQGKGFDLKALLKQVNWPAFLSRGALASRLQKQPVSGTAHALVFFGSLVLIIGHALFPLSLIGVPVFDGTFGWLVMGLGREVAGVALFFGLLFFLIRRGVAPPERLTVGKTRKGFVALELYMAVILLAGYVTEGFRIGYEPAHHDAPKFIGLALGSIFNAQFGTVGSMEGFQLFWWIHGLLGVGFIALIAHTPLSHILLGPINSALAARRTGVNLSPMNFNFDDEDEEDEDEEEELKLGASTLADLNQKNLLDFAACLWCGRCHDACPAAQTGKPLSPKTFMATCASYLEEGKADDDSLLAALGRQEIFDCVTCGACAEVCPVSNSPVEAILEFRRHYVMEQSDMPETMAAANRNLESREHPFVGTGASPDDWRQGLEVPIFEKGKTEYLFWLGCAVIYEERAQKVARAMVGIFEAAGVSYGILEESRCTGDVAKQMGNEMQFVEIAEANIEDFKEEGVQKIITMCAHCFNSFDRYYPELGGNYETLPHSVFIDQLIHQGKLNVTKNPNETLTYHDPCYLARHNDIMDEPRDAVNALGLYVEMPRHKKESFCCGAGGGNYWGGQGGDARISDVRAKEALDTGADKIVTSCPFCLLMLTDGVSKETEIPKVYDVAELIVEALAEAGEDLCPATKA